MVSRKFALALVLGATTVIAAAAISVRIGPSAAAQSGQGLEGSWMSEATAAVEGLFPLGGLRLTTYNADGTLVSTSRGRGIIPTTSHGTWMRVGDREFATTWIGFARDADGEYTRLVKARATIQVNDRGDEYTSRGLNEVYDLDGNVFTRDSTTGQAKRIRVERAN
jgi:hypothetical protein